MHRITYTKLFYILNDNGNEFTNCCAGTDLNSSRRYFMLSSLAVQYPAKSNH